MNPFLCEGITSACFYFDCHSSASAFIRPVCHEPHSRQVAAISVVKAVNIHRNDVALVQHWLEGNRQYDTKTILQLSNSAHSFRNVNNLPNIYQTNDGSTDLDDNSLQKAYLDQWYESHR